jgi:WD40 repeat protein
MWRFQLLFLAALVAAHPLSAQELKLRRTLACQADEIVFNLDGKTLAAASNLGEIKLWGKTTVVLKDGSQHWGSRKLAFSPDGKTLAAAGDFDMETIQFWDAAAPKHPTTLPGHSPCGVASFVFSPDGKTILSAGVDDGKVKIWDTATGKNTAMLDSPAGDRVFERLSPDGKLLTVMYSEKTIKVFEVRRNTKL